MKIIKVNDNQIRCVLSRDDLDARHMKLSELAYGSKKARSLFDEMMKKANEEYGFDVSDHPIMVEAIPVSSEELVLVITKVTAPDELDTRFAKFSNYQSGLIPSDSSDNMLPPSDRNTTARDIIEMYRKMMDKKKKDVPAKDLTPANEEKDAPIDGVFQRIFVFHSLEDIIHVSHVIGDNYHGESTVLRLNQYDDYILHITQSTDNGPDEFNRVCNIISEYGSQISPNSDRMSTIREHSHPIIKEDAIGRMQLL